MELICAIDLLEGGAVRLEQGDYARRITAPADPVALAGEWVADGARHLHVIDLEGARRGRPVHLVELEAIARSVHAAEPATRIEAGGGLRREADVAAVLDAGADEAILGTAAIERPGFLASCVARWPGRIIASLDLRSGGIATDGWLRTRRAPGLEVAARLLDEGARRLIVTSTERDGTLGGPHLELLTRYRRALPGAWLAAAGGIASDADLRALAEAGVDGAVVGTALLRGRIDLRTVLDQLATVVPRP